MMKMKTQGKEQARATPNPFLFHISLTLKSKRSIGRMYMYQAQSLVSLCISTILVRMKYIRTYELQNTNGIISVIFA